MKLAGSRILLTGASGGIGRCLALELSRRGARLALVGRDRERLAALVGAIESAGGGAAAFEFDLERPDGHADLVERAVAALGGLDALINNAGQSRLTAFTDETESSLRRLFAVNVMAPMLLARAALPHLLRGDGGTLLNIGSVFGAIGYPYYAAYSASKFALRGFSEALRRELADTGVKVLYVAPRATRTDMNGPAARALMSETGAAMDEPEKVATAIADALAEDLRELCIGMPERFFARVNGLLPGIVDGPLVKQGRMAARHLRGRRAAK
jgi:short-subunit dehydrogenase